MLKILQRLRGQSSISARFWRAMYQAPRWSEEVFETSRRVGRIDRCAVPSSYWLPCLGSRPSFESHSFVSYDLRRGQHEGESISLLWTIWDRRIGSSLIFQRFFIQDLCWLFRILVAIAVFTLLRFKLCRCGFVL